MKRKAYTRPDPDSADRAWPDKPFTDTDCEYYPCHFMGQDCTFCFCPFYPCLDGLTCGGYVVSKRTGRDVWSCKRCVWIHKKDVVADILPGIRQISKDDMKSLLELRLRFL